MGQDNTNPKSSQQNGHQPGHQPTKHGISIIGLFVSILGVVATAIGGLCAAGLLSNFADSMPIENRWILNYFYWVGPALGAIGLLLFSSKKKD